MNVLLPTPGTPEMPRRNDWPLSRQQRVQHLVGARAVIGMRRFEQGDGLRDGAALLRARLARHLLGHRALGRRQHLKGSAVTGRPAPAGCVPSTSFALTGIGVPGP